MARDLSRHQQGIVKRYYEHEDTILSNKLSELVSELWLAEDEKTKLKLWGKAQVALMRVGVDAGRVATVVGKRDLKALAELVAQADAGKVAPKATQEPAQTSDPEGRGVGGAAPSHADTRTIGQMKAEKAAEGGYDSLDEPNLNRAYKAFKRKLKSLVRDDESRLGGRYVSAGRKSDIAAITPPKEFPGAVWNKLVEQGKLKRAGEGTFSLP